MSDPTEGDRSMIPDFIESDEDPMGLAESIRAKGIMDGAGTLLEAALKLRTVADQLVELYEDGWELTGPVEDDYGYISR